MHPVSVDVELGGAIVAAETRLRELDGERDAVACELAELRSQQERAIADDAGENEQADVESWTPQRKLALFADLFRGREDVFPQRWEKPAKGKSGWSPRCDNEWRAGICAKPRVKCGECPHQAFPAPAETELLKHLQGHRVMGVYPLLADDTCRLLAIDLDERSWRADVLALRDTCDTLGLVPAVERSRSGDGAHIWFFFSEPVHAALARRLGLMLLTDTMARSPTLGMASYDRLFPSQDTLPKGGFGNLIALPLQRQAREHGNTLFVDERLEPFEDQWSYLASLPRITPGRLGELVAHRTRAGSALRVPEEAEDDDAPWRPARMLTERLAGAKLPATVCATLAQRLYVRCEGLPPVLLDALRRLAAFSNPEFLELQAMRKSTATTPRVIACFEQTGDFLALPRGCREQLEELLSGLNIALNLSDERTEGNRLKTRFTGELTPRQEEAVPAMLAHDLGVLCAPPGIGKTVIAARLIAERERSTLVLVHRKPLLGQWVKCLSEFLDLPADAIGTIGGGRTKATGKVDIATVQSLARHKTLDQLLAGYGHIIADECHHVAAVTTERVIQAAPARYVTGVTGTLKRRDGHHPIVAMQCGPVRHTIELSATRSSRPLALRVVRRDTLFDPQTLPTEASIHEVYAALAVDDQRTALIANDTLDLIAQGRCPIVLTERREHLQRLAEHLDGAADVLVTLHGDMRPSDHRSALEQLATNDGAGGRVVLATGRYIGEGFDDPRLDTMLLAMPIAWKGTVVQYAGRLHRAHPGKHDTLVYDYVDAELPVLRRMFAKRMRAYRSLGYKLAEGPGSQ